MFEDAANEWYLSNLTNKKIWNCVRFCLSDASDCLISTFSFSQPAISLEVRFKWYCVPGCMEGLEVSYVFKMVAYPEAYKTRLS